MGCGSSRGSAVVPLEARLAQAPNGVARPMQGQVSRRASEAPPIPGKEPPQEDLPRSDTPKPPVGASRRAVLAPAMAFEVPLNDGAGDGPSRPSPEEPERRPEANGESQMPRRPPRRLQRLEGAPPPPTLTHRVLDQRQDAAEYRRQQILSQRVKSAHQLRQIKRRVLDGNAAPPGSREQDEDPMESMGYEESSVEL